MRSFFITLLNFCLGFFSRQLLTLIVLLNLTLLVFLNINAAFAEPISIKQSIAKASVQNNYVFQFYKNRNYKLFWLGNTGDNSARLKALTFALADASMHGLPSSKFSSKSLVSEISSVNSNEELGYLDVKLTLVFIKYAHVLRHGILKPKKIDKKNESAK